MSKALLLPALLAAVLGSCAPVRPEARPGAIQQVGFVWLKRPGDPEDRQKVVAAVHGFARDIPEVLDARVGPSDGIGGPLSDASYDIGFILTFADEAARQRYNRHPEHEKAASETFLPLSRKLLFYRFVNE
jgi:hypothetical protein